MARAKTAEELDAQIKVLQERKRQLLAKERQEERKARNHALIVMGAMVEAACGGDWKAIDMHDLNDYLQRYRKAMRKACKCPAEPLTEAKVRVREFERWQRDSAKADREETEMLVSEVLDDGR